MLVVPLLSERVNGRTRANWRKLVQALYDSPNSERTYRYMCLADGYLQALNDAELIDDAQYQSLYDFLQKI
ncbi:hypothetical protein FJD35_05110 [Pseudomonas mandelii]|uniref:Uncharacterized protein n=1 Tax=Pseudomonas mandelii TaxID=75612 RepID=A0ABY0VE01_9PSED|nr:hypothetical protein FJD35_05110 [Pseudomonas mandelii]SDU12311.1 hypothetical protein SAMN04489801_0987 [Pseudomonas mandelii]